jgi:hypothetical protein
MPVSALSAERDLTVLDRHRFEGVLPTLKEFYTS